MHSWGWLKFGNPYQQEVHIHDKNPKKGSHKFSLYSKLIYSSTLSWYDAFTGKQRFDELERRRQWLVNSVFGIVKISEKPKMSEKQKGFKYTLKNLIDFSVQHLTSHYKMGKCKVVILTFVDRATLGL